MIYYRISFKFIENLITFSDQMLQNMFLGKIVQTKKTRKQDILLCKAPASSLGDASTRLAPVIFASQEFRSRSPLSSPLADWAGISDPCALDFSWIQLLLAASNQIAANIRSRKHHVYAVENVNTWRSHFTST